MRRMWALILSAGLMAPILTNAGDFDRVVHEFSRQSGVSQTKIPFFFLARAAIAVGHPAGTSQINLAIFENASFDADRFSRLTDAAVRSDWKPMIRVRSKGGESTNIYARASGREMHMIIATYENNEATFVEVRVEPDALMRFIQEHDGHDSRE